jgi:hypothetical protein
MLAALGVYIWWIVSGVLLAGLIFWKFLYKFHWFNFVYGLPLIGTMSKLKDATPDAKDKSWTRAEKKLCTDYGQFIQLGDIEAFNNRAEYLRKAGDLGVKPMPGWIWVFLWLLIIAEGFGFAYSLGTWMAMEGSENTFAILMVVVALVIAVPSATLSHEAGVRFHRYMERKRNYQDWKAGRRNNDDQFKTEIIALQKDQSSDDNLFAFNQYANRAHSKISLLPLWGAIAWAIVVVAGSTTMRISHLEKVMAQESVGAVSSQSANSGNPFAAPAELAQPQVAAEDKAGKDIKSSTLVEGSAAFIMLAFLYLATQGVGAAVAAKYAFLGSQSEAAYNGNFGFETYDDFLRYYEPIVQIAQARLQTLQERLGNSPDNNRGMQLHHSFDDYLVEQRQKGIDRKAQNTTPNSSAVHAPAAPAMTAPISNAQQAQPQINELIHAAPATVVSENSAQPKSKFCSDCGSAIAATAKFCSGCGSSFA